METYISLVPLFVYDLVHVLIINELLSQFALVDSRILLSLQV
jgi:hypothetical protein